MKKINFFIVLIAVILSGCSTTKIVRPTIKDNDVIQASYDKVWSAVVAAISEMTLPIEAIEKDSGLITTGFVNFASGSDASNEIDRIAVKPFILLGIWNQGRYTLSIFFKSNGENATNIKISTYIEAFEKNMTESWHICYSKGILEQTIFDSVRSKL